MAVKLHPAHKGFTHIEDIIAHKEGISKKNAGAILASRTRAASKAAKRRNPALNKVKMPKGK
jgi:hypothetical protein